MTDRHIILLAIVNALIAAIAASLTGFLAPTQVLILATLSGLLHGLLNQFIRWRIDRVR